MTTGVWVTAGTLTLPYGTLRTLHEGVSEVRVKQNLHTNLKQVGKRVSLLGREDTLAFNEISFLREIDHSNIARVFDVAEVAGSDPALKEVEIIMPYYEGGSLYDVLARGERFSSAQARDISSKALRGLAHLHDHHRILHRDMKPGNLFLADDESLVKIGDFGEAMRMDPSGHSDPLLSPQFWTAPETFSGSRHAVTAEVFSMGMTLREILSGPLPYDEYSREDLAKRLSEGKVAVRPRDLDFAVHTPGSLRRIAQRATHKDPAHRFRSAEEMLDALLGARFVDWDWPVDGPDGEWTCHGRFYGEQLRVTTRPIRSKGWRARAEQLCRSGWRRIRGVQEVTASTASEAASTVFSQIDKHLVRV